jgi:Ca2+-binding RTX toxin-like protein
MTPILRLDGDDGNNYLYGGPAPEMINGKGGDDVLFGGDGNDTLDGGSGNDVLAGGAGHNTFRFGRGGGMDRIDPAGPATTGQAGPNSLVLGSGIAPSDLVLRQVGPDLVLGIAGTADQLTLAQFFVQPILAQGMAWNYQLADIRFDDGSYWDLGAILAHARQAGEPLRVLGAMDNESSGRVLDGGGGNDRLYGFDAALLYGGSGNDTLTGSASADVLFGGSGDDQLHGGAGNDWLDGGSGNDLLDGGGGYDTYHFGYGSGQDVIAAAPLNQGDMLTIDLGPGVQPAMLGFTRAGEGQRDLVLDLPQGERLTVLDYFTGANRMVTLHFADGSILDKNAIDMRVYGGVSVPSMDGGAGADTLHGSAAGEILRGADGDDALIAMGGDDVLLGGNGNDWLDGGDGNDVFDGGAGDDHIQDSGGDNLMLFGRASGHDQLQLPLGEATLTVLFEAGIGAADVLVSRSNGGQGMDLQITVGGAEAGILVSAYFSPFADAPLPALTLQFADGLLWDAGFIRNLVLGGDEGNNQLTGTMGNDRIDGRGGDDMISGREGDDLLLGGAGRDVLLGNSGNDTLDGGQGDDMLDDQIGNNTYVFARGDGRDMIFNNTRSVEARYDTIAFGAGIAPQQVQLQRVNQGGWDDLVIRIDDAPDQQITLQNFITNDPMYATNMQLKEIRFADGSAWDNAAILQRLMQGSELGDTLLGTSGHDLLEGRGGDDRLSGLAGNDTLIGGRGIDMLEGGQGVDTYVFASGDGRDTLVDSREAGGAGNIIRFGAGIVPQQVRVGDSPLGLEISYGSGDVIVLPGLNAGQPASALPVERLEFADGSSRAIDSFFNHAPVLAKPLADQSAAGGQLFKLTLPASMFSDPDAGDTLTLSVSQSLGMSLPSWLSFDSASATLQGLVPQGLVAGYELEVMAKDRAGLHATDVFKLMVGVGNRVPVVKSVSAGIKVDEGRSFGMLTPTFSDPDSGDVLSVKVTLADGRALPSWLWFDGKDWVNGVSGFDSAGTYKLSATATDQGGLSVSSTFDIVVKNINRAPMPVEAIAPLQAARDTAFASVLPARMLVDPDGDVLGYKLALASGAPLPAWLSFDAATRTLSGTPSAADAGTLSLTLIGIDGAGLGGGSNFKLTVAADALQNLSGTAGVDVLNGQSAGDTLFGQAGNDQLNGFGGNDTLDGGLGADRMAGGSGDDRYLVDAAGDQVVELANEGRDTVLASVSYTLPTNTEVLVLDGSAPLSGYGNAGENVLQGNSGNNFLNGNGGNDILQGGAGNDTLTDTLGKNLFDGGLGADTLNGGSGIEMFIGGAGNDTINPGGGIDIIAFNRGDGSDALIPDGGRDNILSLGRGIGYADLTLSKVGNDLVLGTGAGDQISLKSWFSTLNYHSVAKLQLFIEGGSDYQSASPLSMNSQKIQLFNFDTLTGKFEQALQLNPALASWNLAPELAGALIRSSGNTAFGGDLAQQYATSGSLANVAQVPALAIIGSSAFGDANHYLAGAPQALADGTAFLM